MYAANAARNGWLEEVRVIFFGPAEGLLIADEEVAEAAAELPGLISPAFCKAIADREGISEQIEERGYAVEYVGRQISELIGQGYVPLVF